MKFDNPFTITFGKQPNKYIVRYEDTDRIVQTFCADNVVSQTFLIEGIRGSGKTVLMTSVAKEFESRDEWIVINLNSTMDLLANFAIRLQDICDVTPEVVNNGINVSVAGFGVGIGANQASNDYVGIIDNCFKKIIKKNKKVLITIDEILNDENMRVFASQFQIFVRQDYPVFIIMTGLHDNIYAVQNDPALTFLLRSPKIDVGPLSLLQIARQYKNIFKLTEDDSFELASLTKGYAFAFQALGVSYWDYRELGMEAVFDEYDALLDDFVYKKIWMSLTRKEREIMKMITDGETKAGYICKTLSINNSSFSRYRENLIQKGVIESIGYGYVTMALPRFYEIIKSYGLK